MDNTANAKPTNYTAAQEAIIRAACEAGPNGKGNLEIAKALAERPDMRDSDGKERSYRSLVAKIGRMGLPYAGKEPTSKDGSPIVKKTDLVERIGAIVTGNLDGLEKSPKAALVAIAAYVEEAASRVKPENGGVSLEKAAS